MMESHMGGRRTPRARRASGGPELLPDHGDFAVMPRAPLPTRRWFHAGAQQGGRVHLIGGAPLGLENLGTLHEVYDLAADRWVACAPLPQARWMSAAAPLGDGVLLVGGYSMLPRAVPSAEVWLYEGAADRWRPVAPLPAPIGFPIAATVGGRVFVHDGGDNELPSRGQRWFLYDPAIDGWTTIARSPSAFTRGAVVASGERLIALGGLTESGRIEPAVNALDPVAGTWTPLASLPHRLVLRAASALGDRLVVAGGYGADGEAESVIDVLELSSGRWSTPAALSFPRASATLAVHGDRLVVLGGWNARGPIAETEELLLSVGRGEARRAV